MFNRKGKRASLTLTVAALLSIGVASSAMADTAWEQSHPRRDQVNDRLARQNLRIRHEVKEGDMTRAEAARLHHQHHQIRREERLMASQNGGHITRQEQKALNQQENRVSREIGR
jgi:hypothetical protein